MMTSHILDGSLVKIHTIQNVWISVDSNLNTGCGTLFDSPGIAFILLYKCTN